MYTEVEKLSQSVSDARKYINAQQLAITRALDDMTVGKIETGKAYRLILQAQEHINDEVEILHNKALESVDVERIDIEAQLNDSYSKYQGAI